MRKKHSKIKYADCQFRVMNKCMALKDTYCDYEDCNFYKPRTEAEEDDR